VRSRLSAAPGTVAAVLPVAAFGRMPDLAAWRAFRRETGTPVLVDGAAAFDAVTDVRLPVVVSLNAAKALGAGEGGFIASSDEGFLTRVRELTSYGLRGTREAQVPATNAKLSEYAAAVGLAGLDGWAASRGRFAIAAQNLRMALIDTPEVVFQPGWGASWISSVCVVRLPEGALDTVEAGLAAEGIDTRRWWANGCHESPAFATCPRDSLPQTERLARTTLGLPFAVDLDVAAVARIAGALRRALGRD
jgi:dTDP-4-amino-4,6-dideoxygalactose transaminase